MRTTNDTTTDKIIEIPYVGYSNLTGLDYFKTATSCGVCAVWMILSGKKIQTDINKFIEDGHKNGGFTSSGWSHDYLLKKLEEADLSYLRQENCPIQKSIEQIKQNILANNPVVVSVNKLCLEQTSFHIVLLVGIKLSQNDELLGFFYHDPASTSEEKGAYRYVTIPNFIQFWRKMMLIKK